MHASPLGNCTCRRCYLKDFEALLILAEFEEAEDASYSHHSLRLPRCYGRNDLQQHSLQHLPDRPQSCASAGPFRRRLYEHAHKHAFLRM